MIMRYQYRFRWFVGLFLLAVALVVVGCGPANSSVAPAPEEAPEMNAMPTDQGAGASPAVGESAYPPPQTVPTPQSSYPAPEEDLSLPLLAMDKPLQAGETAVSGVGPPGLVVYILNVTFMGQELGAGVVGDDGRFAINVANLQPGTRIGLTADLEAAGLTPDDIRTGDGAVQVPQVGIFYDSFVIPQN